MEEGRPERPASCRPHFSSLIGGSGDRLRATCPSGPLATQPFGLPNQFLCPLDLLVAQGLTGIDPQLPHVRYGALPFFPRHRDPVHRRVGAPDNRLRVDGVLPAARARRPVHSPPRNRSSLVWAYAAATYRYPTGTTPEIVAWPLVLRLSLQLAVQPYDSLEANWLASSTSVCALATSPLHSAMPAFSHLAVTWAAPWERLVASTMIQPSGV